MKPGSPEHRKIVSKSMKKYWRERKKDKPKRKYTKSNHTWKYCPNCGKELRR